MPNTMKLHHRTLAPPCRLPPRSHPSSFGLCVGPQRAHVEWDLGMKTKDTEVFACLTSSPAQPAQCALMMRDLVRAEFQWLGLEKKKLASRCRVSPRKQNKHHMTNHPAAEESLI